MSQESSPSKPIDASSLRAEEWSYLAEGGQNLLVRYTDPSATACSAKAPSTLNDIFIDRFGGPAALRVRKRKRKHANDVQEREEDASELLDSQTFQSEIITPLLQDATMIPPGHEPTLLTLASGARALPFSVPIKLQPADGQHGVNFLQELAQRIAPSRPDKRRTVDEIDTNQSVIWAVEDLTAADATSQTAQVLSIEIKPKWMFRHDHCGFSGLGKEHHWKRKYSRYTLHRVYRDPHLRRKQVFEELYDPLDLISEDADRVEKAVRALWIEWNRKPSETDQGDQEDEESNTDTSFSPSPTKKASQKGAKGHMHNNLRVYIGSESVSHGDWHKIAPFFRASSEQETEDALVELLSSRLHLSPELLRLAALQKFLDTIDIAELGKTWEEYTGSSPAFGSSASSPATARDFLREPDLADFKQQLVAVAAGHRPVNRADPESLRFNIVSKVLDATIKDCSVFLRFVRPAPDAAQMLGGRDQAQMADVRTTMRFVDLDPKSASRMGKWWAMDKDIIEAFDRWVVTMQDDGS